MNRRALYSLYCVGLGLAALAVVAAVAYAAIKQPDGDASPVVSPVESTPTDSASPAANDVVPIPSDTPTVAPTATPTPAASQSALPDTATSFLKDFYAAYKKGDAKAMQAFFADDTDAELKSLRSRLFTGVDTNGIPGGPTLFATNSADQKVQSYTVSSATQNGSGWDVSVKESRVSGSGAAVPETTTKVSLVPSGTSWKINSYTRVGGTGKYNALLTP